MALNLFFSKSNGSGTETITVKAQDVHTGTTPLTKTFTVKTINGAVQKDITATQAAMDMYVTEDSGLNHKGTNLTNKVYTTPLTVASDCTVTPSSRVLTFHTNAPYIYMGLKATGDYTNLAAVDFTNTVVKIGDKPIYPNSVSDKNPSGVVQGVIFATGEKNAEVSIELSQIPLAENTSIVKKTYNFVIFGSTSATGGISTSNDKIALEFQIEQNAAGASLKVMDAANSELSDTKGIDLDAAGTAVDMTVESNTDWEIISQED